MVPVMAVLTAAYGPGGASEATTIARQLVRDEIVTEPQQVLFCLLDLASMLLRRLADGTGVSHRAALQELGLAVLTRYSAASIPDGHQWGLGGPA